MDKTVRRADVLREMDVHEDANGRRAYFSISFYKKDGELVSLPRARACGLNMDMAKNRVRGVQQIDAKGNAVGHIYPVCIDNICEFNGQRVNI